MNAIVKISNIAIFDNFSAERCELDSGEKLN